jgi:hypothetical protein
VGESRRLLAWVLALVLVIALAVAGWRLLRDEPYQAHPRPQQGAGIDPTGASEVLARLARALHHGDAAAASRLGADDSSGALLAEAARTAHRAHLVDVQLRYLDEQGGLDPERRWSASVDVSWRYAGFDRAPSDAEVRFTFAPGAGRVLIAGVGGGPDRTPIWLQGELRVVRTAHTLGLAAVDARRYARLAARAVPIVQRVLARWRARLVVEVPRTAKKLQDTLQAEPGEYAQIAAVTTSADGSATPRTPIHVFVNPAVFAGLQARGAQVVMTHEAVHVATGAAGPRASALPLWLVEGFADYVALREVRLPLSTTAGQILAQVEKHGAPRHLPGPTEFDTTRTHLGASYEAAWLACRLLAERHGEDRLVVYYRALSGGAAVGPAFRQHFGLSLESFTRSWRAWLLDQAGRLAR